tara:strand:+ start:1036 stop:1554 length:519 start_codon:yes stop_codon:yes gene_type:complete
MEENVKCKNLLLKIEKELADLQTNSLNVADKLDEQTTKLENISENNENISYQTDVSKWYIKYLSATFGKVYSKLYSYPVRKNATNLYNVLSLKKNIIKHNLYDKNTPNYIEEKNSLDRIVNKLETIKTINKNCNDELDKHNAILEYNNTLIENSEDKIEKNTKDIKNLLLKF